jgi:hypothetical protein
MKLASNPITDQQDCEYLPTKSFVDTYLHWSHWPLHSLESCDTKNSPSRKIFSSAWWQYKCLLHEMVSRIWCWDVIDKHMLEEFWSFQIVCNFANWQDNLQSVDAHDLYEKWDLVKKLGFYLIKDSFRKPPLLYLIIHLSWSDFCCCSLCFCIVFVFW